MKKTVVFVFALMLSSALVWQGCDKSEDAAKKDSTSNTNNNNNNTSTDTTKLISYMVSANWMWNSQLVTLRIPGMSKDTTINAYTDMEACEKDNVFSFTTAGKVNKDEGATKCDPNDPQSGEEGTWKMFNNGKNIDFVPTGEALQHYTVVEITATSFVLTTSDSLDMGGGKIPATIKMGWKAK